MISTRRGVFLYLITFNSQVSPLKIHNPRKENGSMEVSEETVQKIQAFAANRASAEKESTSQPLSATALHAYARRLDGTLHELQERVRRQEEELNKVCTNNTLTSSTTDNPSSFGRFIPTVF